MALKLTVQVRGAEVIGTQLYDQTSGLTIFGDSACGISRRKDGGVETFGFAVTPKLAAGVHRIHVTVIASSCNTSHATVRSSHWFRLAVRS
jgi:hypothetical protein